MHALARTAAVLALPLLFGFAGTEEAGHDGVASRPSPYPALCGPSAEAARARGERHKELRRELEAETLGELASELGLSAPTREAFEARLRSAPRTERERMRSRYVERHARRVGQRAAPYRGLVERTFETLRARAIELTRADTTLTRRAREAELARLRAVQLSWLDPASWGEGASYRAPRPAMLGCAAHLMIDDAWVSGDLRTIALCPGLVLVSASGARSDREIEARIMLLLAHELGHVASGRGESIDRAAEADADRRGAAIFAAELERRPESERLDLTVLATEPFCDPRGDATHRPGAERVEALVREPAVAGAIGQPSS